MRRTASLARNISGRLRRERWLLTKAGRQRLARLAGGAAPRQTIFVSGLQRSGTNMLMDALERNAETQVFHESDARAFRNYRQRGRTTIRRLVDRSPARVVVLKALLEGDEIAALLDAFAPARALWVYRRPADTITSNLARWPGGRNQIDDLVADRGAAGWRGRSMSDGTHALIRRHYAQDMTDASALALFFYYRHQLFFDQGLDRDPRVHLVSYENLVGDPAGQVAELARFSGLRPTPGMWRHIHARSIRRVGRPDIAPEIQNLAETMHRALERARQAQRAQLTAA